MLIEAHSGHALSRGDLKSSEIVILALKTEDRGRPPKNFRGHRI